MWYILSLAAAAYVAISKRSSTCTKANCYRDTGHIAMPVVVAPAIDIPVPHAPSEHCCGKSSARRIQFQRFRF